ncbi:MAG: hypothetical protein WA705_22375 [Candidatus Ozemobacteraceae bacterium]
MNLETWQKVYGRLQEKAMPLSEIHGFIRDAGSRWDIDQLRLLLCLVDGIAMNSDRLDEPTFKIGQEREEDKIARAILEIVRAQAGIPIPVAQIKSLLSSSTVTSTEQIKAICKQIPELEVFGPGLVRLRR